MLIRREFFGPTLATSRWPIPAAPEYYEDWRRLSELGSRSGEPDAQWQLLIFSDFECPACRQFELGPLAEARAQYGTALAVTIVHFPLPQHRFAIAAAAAAICAGREHLFDEFGGIVFRLQDSIGLKSWWSFAADVGVTDSVSFLRCQDAADTKAVIDSGTAVGKRLAVDGTPTVLINGWRFSQPPTTTILNQAIDRLRLGEPPQ